MLKKLLYTVVLASILGACSYETEGANADKVESKVESDEHILSKEESRYVELIKKGEYQTVIAECEKLNDENHQTFRNIATAFKTYNEFKDDHFSNHTGELNYNAIRIYLNSATFIPAELTGDINELRRGVNKKLSFYETNAKKNRNKKVEIGMTKKEVLDRWGRPDVIHNKSEINGKGEAWTYFQGIISFKGETVESVKEFRGL